ncbi:tetratricopeptide repeat protein [Candidatus Sumerlaeota bacterium]|nr:tetratricopeptide repeat protein [Candidatus Sumerlaeota bacterium]
MTLTAETFAQIDGLEDEIVLKGGRRFKGFVVREDEKSVYIRIGGSLVPFRKDQIEEIVGAPTSSLVEKEADILYWENALNDAMTKYTEALTDAKDEAAQLRIKRKMDECRHKIQEQFEQRYTTSLKRAENFASLGEFEQALEAYDLILGDDDINAISKSLIEQRISEVHCKKAEKYIDQLKNIEAIAEIDKAIDICPDYYRSYLLKSRILEAANNRTSKTADLLIQALNLGEDALSDAKKQEINLDVAHILHSEGKASNDRVIICKALEYYEKAIGLMPEDRKSVDEVVDTYLQLGQDFDTQSPEELELTVQGLQRAIELKPNLEDAFLMLGRIYLQLGQYANAVEQFEKVIVLNPGGKGNYMLLGRAYLKNGDLRESEEALLSEVSIDPQNFEAQLTLAEIYLKQKIYLNALKYAKQALELSPTTERPPEIIAASYFGEGGKKYREARLWYNRVLENQPGDMEARLRLAQMDMAEENYDSAQKSFEELSRQLTRMDSDTPVLAQDLSDELKYIYAECQTNLGAIQLRISSNPRVACTYHETALEVMPGFSKASRNLGITYAYMEEWGKAEEKFNDAIKFDPDDADNYIHLGSLYENLKQRELAIESYKRYIAKGGSDWNSVRSKLIENFKAPEASIPESPLAGLMDQEGGEAVITDTFTSSVMVQTETFATTTVLEQMESSSTDDSGMSMEEDLMTTDSLSAADEMTSPTATDEITSPVAFVDDSTSPVAFTDDSTSPAVAADEAVQE